MVRDTECVLVCGTLDEACVGIGKPRDIGKVCVDIGKMYVVWGKLFVVRGRVCDVCGRVCVV